MRFEDCVKMPSTHSLIRNYPILSLILALIVSIICEGHYLNNTRIGQWVFYKCDGTISSTGYYTNGRRSGYWQDPKFNHYREKKHYIIL